MEKGQTMHFPNTVDEFMEQYKMVDYKEVYSNGTEYVPIFRMKQWFEAHPAVNKVDIRAEVIDEIKRFVYRNIHFYDAVEQKAFNSFLKQLAEMDNEK